VRLARVLVSVCSCLCSGQPEKCREPIFLCKLSVHCAGPLQLTVVKTEKHIQLKFDLYEACLLLGCFRLAL